MHPDIQRYIFTVLDRPYCAWGWDLHDRNATFLKGIDAEYFDYIVSSHLGDIDGEDAQRAAMALRNAYHLCLETLFGLMGACLQAPACLPGWILHASTGDIRLLTGSLNRGHMTFPTMVRFPREAIGFSDVAHAILQFTKWAESEDDLTIRRFSGLWSRLANDFVDDFSIAEYNSIKHGFRARAGGFHLRTGLEHEYGVAPPESEMKWIGGSKFGSSFYVVDKVQNAPSSRGDPHFVLKQRSLNWNPHSIALRMQLAKMSIANIKSFLGIILGANPKEMAFNRPEDPNDFEEPWLISFGVNNATLDLVVSEQDIARVTKEELSDLIARSQSSRTAGGSNEPNVHQNANTKE